MCVSYACTAGDGEGDSDGHDGIFNVDVTRVDANRYDIVGQGKCEVSGAVTVNRNT